MGTRRSNGEGQIYQRADGRWEARFAYTDPMSGEAKRSSSYGKTKTAARQAMKEKRDRLQAGQPVKDATITLAEWTERWLATSLRVSDRKESTKETYGN